MMALDAESASNLGGDEGIEGGERPKNGGLSRRERSMLAAHRAKTKMRSANGGNRPIFDCFQSPQ